MKCIDIITIKIVNKMTPENVLKNATIVEVGRVQSMVVKESQSRGNLQKQKWCERVEEEH